MLLSEQLCKEPLAPGEAVRYAAIALLWHALVELLEARGQRPLGHTGNACQLGHASTVVQDDRAMNKPVVDMEEGVVAAHR